MSLVVGEGAAARSAELARLAEAEDTLRAIGAGEVDAFVLSDGGRSPRVFTLTTADRPYRIFVENMRDGAATLSEAGLILYANRRLAELLSMSRESIVGSPLDRFINGDTALQMEQLRGPSSLGTTLEFDLLDGDGRLVPVLVGTSPLEVDGDQLFCLTFTDLSAQKAQDREIARLSQVQAERMADLQRAQAALIEQATHDALTGLPNRALVVDRIDRALAQSVRSGSCTAVLFIDLDRFKQVNDSRGHSAGNAVLHQVARRLQLVLRPMDTVARIGGDEFVVLAPDVENHVHAMEIGSRLVSELFHSDANQGVASVAVSVGISVSVSGRGTAETLLHESDTAMYEAKSRGGALAVVFDAELGRQVHQRSTGQSMLQSALAESRVVPYYQPIIDVPSGQLAGFEALARIAEPDGSILLPAAFIPAAEQSGLVVPLDARVLELACLDAREWAVHAAAGSRLTVAVNVSARQFESSDLGAVVQAMLDRTGMNPSCLHLEITETAIITVHPDVLHQLHAVRELGVEIGLDDFGTGYASLTHLSRLPLSFVKIDQTFVHGMETVGGDERIVSAVVDLAANLGLRSIAEGVETPGQLARLRELGCDQAQGYLFAHPLPPADVRHVVQHGAW
jgi:diguanylate cyclase (GGDEF)-like protein/PAS domain S-box-containing protein